MSINNMRNQAICDIENYCLSHRGTPLTVSFAEGDSYLCLYDNGEWEDNGEWNPGEDTRSLPGFEEWYVLDFYVREVLVPGPNKDPRYKYLIISRRHMPCSVKAGDTVLYEE